MICKNCGEEKNEHEPICSLREFDESIDAIQKRSNTPPLFIMKIIMCVIGIASGVFSLANGVNGFGYWGRGSFSDCEFGADFYTEIYNVTQASAENIGEIIDFFHDFVEVFLIFSGLFCIAFFGYKFFNVIENKDK